MMAAVAWRALIGVDSPVQLNTQDRGIREAGVNPAQSRYGDQRFGAGSPVAGPTVVSSAFA